MKKKVGLKAGATLLACSRVIGNMPLGVLAKDAKQEDGLKIGIMSDTHKSKILQNMQRPIRFQMT